MILADSHRTKLQSLINGETDAMSTTFAISTLISAEFQFCLDLMAAKGMTPCLSTSYEDSHVVNVFSRKTRGTRHAGRSPRANVRYCKATGNVSLMGFK